MSPLCSPNRPGLPPGCGPGAGWARTVETGHVDVLAEAFGARGAEQGVLVIVRVHHPHVVPAAPVWESRRRCQSGTRPHTSGLLPLWRGCLPGCGRGLREGAACSALGWLPSLPLPHRAGGQPSASCPHSLCPRGAQCSHSRSAGGPANMRAQKLGARGAATKPSATLEEESFPSGEAVLGEWCGAMCVCVCVHMRPRGEGWPPLPCWPAGRDSRDQKFHRGPRDLAGPGCSSRGSLGPCTSAWCSPRPGLGLADPAGVAQPVLNRWGRALAQSHPPASIAWR